MRLTRGEAEGLKRLSQRAYPGREVHVACDVGEFHHARAAAIGREVRLTRRDLRWPLLYGRSGNPVKRWRRHKHAALTDVFRATVDEFTVKFKISVARINGRRS
jgi:hypothetical protein